MATYNPTQSTAGIDPRNQVTGLQRPRILEPQRTAPEVEAPPLGVVNRAAALSDKPEVPKKKLSWFTWMLMAFGALILLGLIVSFARTASAPMPTIDTSAQDAPAAEPVNGASPANAANPAPAPANPANP